MTTQIAQTTSSAPAGFTFEQLMESIRVTREEFLRSKEESDAEWQKMKAFQQETDRILQETSLQMKETDQILKENAREMKEFQQETSLQQKETDRIVQETSLQLRENAREMKETNKKIAELGNRIGELVEVMVEGGVVRKFRELGYPFTGCSRRYKFENKELEVSGEIDLFLENGDCALAVEVKTNCSVRDIQDQMDRMERFRQYADARNDKRQFLAAVGGGVIHKMVQEYALKQGIYVILQSGETVEIAELPKGFKAKRW
ncbi:hypothetical protein FACS189443_3660 [Planctomycetales bacterium]|nr:hypothetical protein FACS189443_3660 [Planctomycetales bacterium]